MLRQRCRIEINGIGHYVKGVDKDGEPIFTKDIQDAIILLNQHWSELIKRNDTLQDMKPHLLDVMD